MAYSAEISRSNPTCFLFLIDQSKSMRGLMGGAAGTSKAQAVADAVNRLLYNLVLRCVWGQAVLDRFHVGVLGYGPKVGAVFGGTLAGRELVPVGELARNPLRIEQRVQKVDDGAGRQVDQPVKFPVWFEATAEGRTPMVATLERASRLLSVFLADHPDCFPPLVVNLSDGEATDGNPEITADRLRQLSSGDGNVLLFNAHLSSSAAQPVEFPDSETGLPDEAARRLFRMSSQLPPVMAASARQAGLAVSPQTRGFVFNADLGSVVRFLDIGTRVDSKNLPR
jgi:hypothetical protein